MTPRNVRAYRTKGLLAPPARVGRTSRYQESHLRRLREIRQLRDAGLPLKMIIDAANRGEDLGPTGALWQAAGPTAIERGRRRLDQLDQGAEDELTATGSLLVDPEAYRYMRTLREAGVPASTVLRLALRAAEAGRVLAQELSDVLAEGSHSRPAAGQGPGQVPEHDRVPDLVVLDGEPERADVIDLVTVITRSVLGSSDLTRP